MVDLTEGDMVFDMGGEPMGYIKVGSHVADTEFFEAVGRLEEQLDVDGSGLVESDVRRCFVKPVPDSRLVSDIRFVFASIDRPGYSPCTLLAPVRMDDQCVPEGFVEAMQDRLDANDRKLHWSAVDVASLYNKLQEEVEELGKAISRNEGKAVVHEAADVANAAMMLSTKFR